MSNALTQKILITFGFLFAYRVLAYVPVPGVDTDVIASYFNGQGVGDMINMFSGGAIERFSIISLGIMPYITASIVMELMAATFASIKQMKKERDGMQKLYANYPLCNNRHYIGSSIWCIDWSSKYGRRCIN